MTAHCHAAKVAPGKGSPGKMSSLRFAFVGCGGIARHHLKALRGCAHPTQVVAAVDVKKENAAKFAELIPQDEDCQVRGGGAWECIS